MAGTDTILDHIDRALADDAVSPDAMRSIPAGAPLALRIGEDGSLTEVPMRPGRTLADTRAAIDCRAVDCVNLSRSYDMWIDDEGLYVSGPNLLATLLAGLYGTAGQTYHGAVVITRADATGDTLPLTAVDLAHFRALLGGTCDHGYGFADSCPNC